MNNIINIIGVIIITEITDMTDSINASRYNATFLIPFMILFPHMLI